jgi:hypothetical protein
MRSIPLSIRATRELGLGSVTAFALYELQRRVGWLRYKTPMKGWDAVKLETLVCNGVPTEPATYSLYRLGTGRSFFFDPQVDLSTSLQHSLSGTDEALLAEADEILAGKFRLFGGPATPYGLPPDWSKFPALVSEPTPIGVDRRVHWTAFDPYDFPQDIKLLWEPARFGWAYVLGRAYRLNQEKKYAEAFWQLLGSWREQNPPNTGPHWISAQEVAIRLLALVFSLFAFHPYLAEDPGKLVLLMETIVAHAERIPPTLLYSRAQGNNHLIVEAAGLYTAGLLFPEMKHSARWRSEGRRWLVSALSKQVFPDGGYVQHSANYQRLALQATLWAIRLGQLNKDHFPLRILTAVRNTTSCLGSMVQAATGTAPNFGSNDGALLFSLTTCTFQDYRPVVQLAHCCLSMKRPFISGPWDEACFWFGFRQDEDGIGKREKVELLESRSTPTIVQRGYAGSQISLSDRFEGSEKVEEAFPQAGLYFLRGNETWGMFRCATFSHRPGHSDQLHLDLWWRGENIARDSGTYLYNGTPPWQNSLATAKVHNTGIVDEKEPMSRAGRFLWLDWAQGMLLYHQKSEDGLIECISGEHDGYQELNLHIRRSVIRAGDEFWMVVDDVIGNGRHSLRCGWLLPNDPWELDGASVLLKNRHRPCRIRFISAIDHWALYQAGRLLEGEDIARPKEILGWFSPTYAVKEYALYFVASMERALPLKLITLWCLGDADPDHLKVEWEDSAGGYSVLSRVSYDQSVLDL